MLITPKVAVDVIIFTVREESLQVLFVQLKPPVHSGCGPFPVGWSPAASPPRRRRHDACSRRLTSKMCT